MFRNTRTGNYDGVHYYGEMGRKLYSQSVKNVFKDVMQNQNITEDAPLPKNYHQKFCPQALYQKK